MTDLSATLQETGGSVLWDIKNLAGVVTEVELRFVNNRNVEVWKQTFNWPTKTATVPSGTLASGELYNISAKSVFKSGPQNLETLGELKSISKITRKSTMCF